MEFIFSGSDPELVIFQDLESERAIPWTDGRCTLGPLRVCIAELGPSPHVMGDALLCIFLSLCCNICPAQSAETTQPDTLWEVLMSPD